MSETNGNGHNNGSAPAPPHPIPDGFAISDTLHLVYGGDFTPPLALECDGVVVWPWDGSPMRVIPPADLPLPDGAPAGSADYPQAAAIALANAASLAAELLTSLAAASTAYMCADRTQKALTDGAAHAAAAATRAVAAAGIEAKKAHSARVAALAESDAYQTTFLA